MWHLFRRDRSSRGSASSVVSSSNANIQPHSWPAATFQHGVQETISILNSPRGQTICVSEGDCPSCSSPRLINVSSATPLKSPTKPVTSRSGLLPVRLFDVERFQVVQTAHLCSRCKETALNYSCISHVWGKTTPLPAPLIPGATWPIPVSNSLTKLSTLIYSAIHVHSAKYIWIDVLCIDQGASTNHEVALMRFYYSNALGCVVLLEDVPEVAMTWLKESRSVERVELADRHLSTMSFKFDDLILAPTEAAEIVKHMSAVLENAWFHRLWTFQEFCLPGTVEFVNCGSGETLDLDRVMAYSRLLNPRRLALKDTDGKVAKCVKKLTELRALNDIKNTKGKMTVAELLSMTIERRCFYLHDRIYGMLGMLEYGAAIPAESLNLHMATGLDLGAVTTRLYHRATYNLLKASVQNGDASLLWFSGKSLLGFLPDLQEQQAKVTDFAQLPLTNVSKGLSVTDDGMLATESFLAYQQNDSILLTPKIRDSSLSLLIAVYKATKQLGLPESEALHASGVPLTASAEDLQKCLTALSALSEHDVTDSKDLEAVYRKLGWFPFLDMCKIKLTSMLGTDTTLVASVSTGVDNGSEIAIIYRVNCEGSDKLSFWDISQVDFMERSLVLVGKEMEGSGEEFRVERVGVVLPRELTQKWDTTKPQSIRIGRGGLEDL
ncbi:hypothetical protein BCR33DRAFT_711052 [Rhizoclosmatium globosum]|uniref:Heterokaryon incompatibility domain-containing protein n=1 Tax=Rhizoclosmatium globosum TaxID=329046 RepID=A0A1Y2D326_9FUNG|nr:hypothetical protein BCR33DRAFT_711052 [Rhizoclosmatium globosum]|eukprot:ORY53698.1 hypothetical protein BCR33DRAFT_711052 [Rhizoclosmatium globosum]